MQIHRIQLACTTKIHRYLMICRSWPYKRATSRLEMFEPKSSWGKFNCLGAGVKTKQWKIHRDASDQNVCHFTWPLPKQPKAKRLTVWRFNRIGCRQSKSSVPFHFGRCSCPEHIVRDAFTDERTQKASYWSDSVMYRTSMCGRNLYSAYVIWILVLGKWIFVVAVSFAFLPNFVDVHKSSMQMLFILQLSRKQAFAQWFEKLLDSKRQLFHLIIFANSERNP